MSSTMTKEEMDAEVLECARYGDDDDLRQLLNLGANVNHRDAGGSTALHKSSANGELGCMAILKEFGATFAANDHGNLPCHWAAQNGKAAALRFLFDNYPMIDVLAKNSFGRSTLTEAFQSQNSDVIELCLSHSSATEERLVDTAGEGEGPMEVDEQEEPPFDETENVQTQHTYREQHAVHHLMRFDPSAGHYLKIRELPISRADCPFGSASAPQDDTTGLAIWPSAVLAARWLSTDLKHVFQDKVVVELGCGCGVPGLAIAAYCSPKSVYLSDIHIPTLANTIYNVQLNSVDISCVEQLQIDDSQWGVLYGPVRVSSSYSPVPVTISRLNWTDASTYPPEPVDIVIGSDLVYDTNILAYLQQAVNGLLSPSGSFYYIAPEDCRNGMHNLIQKLQEIGVVCVEKGSCSADHFANPLVQEEEGVGSELLNVQDAYVLHFYDLAMQTPHSFYHFKRR